MLNSRSARGFTLIELLIVIGIIGFLAAAILVAVDPVKRIQDARNAKRWSEVNAILNAILTKQTDDRAIFDGDEGTAPTITAPIITDLTADGSGNVQVIVRDSAGVACNLQGARPGCDQKLDTSVGVKCVADLSANTPTASTLVPNYIAEIPLDPLGVGAATPCSGTGSTGCSSPNATLGDEPIGDQNTGYYIHRTLGNRVEIGACYPDQGATIKVRR